MSGGRTVVVTTKNEGPFLLEWVIYHRLIGFDRVVVFANDCTDGSERLLSTLEAAGLVSYHDNSELIEGFPDDPQNRAYRRAFAMPEVVDSEWVLVIDADEFFCINAGEGRLDDLFQACGSADVISATWRIFGNSGLIEYQDKPIMSQFLCAAPAEAPLSFRHYGFKSMFRPEYAHRLGVHRPFLKGRYKRDDVPLKWLNGSGEDITQGYRVKGWASTRQSVGYDLCQVNHYMIKSNELFLAKRYRGTANSKNANRIDFDYYKDFNSNHTQETSITRWTETVQQKIRQLCKQHPEIAEAHGACVAHFKTMIAQLRADLAEKDPEVAKAFLEASVARETVKQQQQSLLQAPKSPPPGPKAETEAEEAQNDDVDDPNETKAKEVLAAPQWLADLRHSPFREGFYQSSGDFAAVCVERSTDQLVVSFDNLSNVNDKSLDREPWAYKFIKDNGYSVLGILSFKANWYRDEKLFDFFDRLKAEGFFRKFKRVAFVGTSMGGYGAAAFSAAAPGATVIAFSPQSTLDTRLVPWEKRFNKGRAQDWSGRYADAAAGTQAAERVYLLYDSYFEPDLRHAKRFHGANIVHLPTWHSGHKSALFLRRAEILKPIMAEGVKGTLDRESFFRLYGKRRKLPWYINAITDQAIRTGGPSRAERVARQLDRENRNHLARAVRKRIADAAG
ncbi:glycosyltransferase family 2 protein [Rhodobacteraceae bacterium NNCM2]|nr:glycosyltransferase family 2 protein [Coraliihabitans acroporae]